MFVVTMIRAVPVKFIWEGMAYILFLDPPIIGKKNPKPKRVEFLKTPTF